MPDHPEDVKRGLLDVLGVARHCEAQTTGWLLGRGVSGATRPLRSAGTDSVQRSTTGAVRRWQTSTGPVLVTRPTQPIRRDRYGPWVCGVRIPTAPPLNRLSSGNAASRSVGTDPEQSWLRSCALADAPSQPRAARIAAPTTLRGRCFLGHQDVRLQGHPQARVPQRALDVCG